MLVLFSHHFSQTKLLQTYMITDSVFSLNFLPHESALWMRKKYYLDLLKKLDCIII